jgi:hypothetical protein
MARNRDGGAAPPFASLALSADDSSIPGTGAAGVSGTRSSGSRFDTAEPTITDALRVSNGKRALRNN